MLCKSMKRQAASALPVRYINRCIDTGLFLYAIRGIGDAWTSIYICYYTLYPRRCTVAAVDFLRI